MQLFFLFLDGDDNADDDGHEDKNGGAHEPHFEPIIPLPNEIEVKTGEEDEEELFCHRAKLYRFDSASQQWKERGIGNIKVLKHLLRPSKHIPLLHAFICLGIDENIPDFFLIHSYIFLKFSVATLFFCF